MKKVYYLSTCNTCKRIMDELGDKLYDFEQQDIKTNKITGEQIDQMGALAENFESLFSRKAMKYRSMGLGEKNLTESDYRQLIVDEYTFLKRPVFIVGDQIFIGNSKKVIAALSAVL